MTARRFHIALTKPAAVVVAAGALALLPLAASAARSAAQRSGAPVPLAGATKQHAVAAYGELPLAFVPNRGQTDQRVRYSAQQGGLSVSFTRDEAVLAFAKKGGGASLALRFLGGSPNAIEGQHRGSGKVNYLLGNDPATWRTNLPTYGEVVYRNLWPGVDMLFRGIAGRLKYEFVLRPGANVANIQLAYRGARALSLDKAGNLVIATKLGVLRDERPRSFQQISGRRVSVASRFSLGGNKANAYAFAVGKYDHRRSLVIDPGLVYSTFLGGPDASIAIDATGAAYVSGSTGGGLPTTSGAFDTSFNGSCCDVYVSKLNPTGSALIYSTYLGGSTEDDGKGLAVDAAGDAYVTGITTGMTHGGSDFPTTVGAFDTTHNGDYDSFVTKLNPDGSALLYSTFLGGSSDDRGFAIALDAAGSAYVTGIALSSDFPTSVGAFDTTPSGTYTGFVSKLNPAGSALLYSTFLGGSTYDVPLRIAVDATSGAAYVTGYTTSSDFPTTPGAFDTTQNGGYDVFVTQLNPAGAALPYSTFLGGSGSDQAAGIAIDATGNAYVDGITASSDFPTTPGAFDASQNGGGDAFVAKLNPAGAALLYSTFLGGSGNDGAAVIALDAAGSAYVTGQSGSSDFPTSVGAFDTTQNGATDAFVTRLNPVGSSLLYSTFLGGSADETGSGIAVAAGAVYVAGATFSGDFPTTVGAFNTTHDGNYDGFVTKLIPVGSGEDTDAPTITVTTPPEGGTYVLGQVVNANYGCQDEAGGSGLASCLGTVASGTPIDTATVGTKTFTVTSADNATNTSSVSHNYSVTYSFSGFQAPVDNPNTVNTGKAGKTYPLKWQLRDANGNFIGALSAVVGVVVKPTSCASFTGDPTDALEATATGGTSLRYDTGANQYIYNWATPSKGCYTLFLKLDSGQALPAFFNLS